MTSMASNTTISQSTNKLIPLDSISVYNCLGRWVTIHHVDQNSTDSSAWQRRYYKPFAIENFPCQVRLIDYQPPDKIRIWIEEKEADVEKCSDYMSMDTSSGHQRAMKKCWSCKWITMDSEWFIDPNEDIDDSIIVLPDFYRLHGDRHAHYGDGGYTFLCYPVWIHEQLPVKDSRRQRLLQTLYELNDQRRDCHPSPSPVEDIIDPDLLPFRPPAAFDRHQWIVRHRMTIEGNQRAQRNFQRDLNDGHYDDLSEHEQIRDTYQWIPSEFTIDPSGKVDIKSPIQHLPVLPEYRQTYADIAHIFHSMLPMFEKLKLVRRDINETQSFQVIVKAQSYNLRAGMKYSGRWHTEGYTENIIAVGVYYLHIDEELTGGALKFRPKHAPQEWYEHIQTDHVVPSIRTGGALVFSNCLPHRFQQIQNLTNQDGRRRTFLNFFIVDPNHPIPLNSTTIIRSPRNIIVDVLDKWNAGRLPDVVKDMILRYLNLKFCWNDPNEAKEFRARVRKAMLDEKSGWGWINWGNCGTTEFVRSLSAWPSYERREGGDRLNHTESE